MACGGQFVRVLVALGSFARPGLVGRSLAEFGARSPEEPGRKCEQLGPGLCGFVLCSKACKQPPLP